MTLNFLGPAWRLRSHILDKKEYALTSGDPGVAVDTIGYSYYSIWKDKLTSYDNTTISYDNIGNPQTISTD